MSHQEKRVNIYSAKDLKNTVDEHIPKTLGDFGYTQSHCIQDARLAIGYGSVVVAGITAYMDYYIGFIEMKSFITIGVVIYFILTALYNGCLFYYERGLIYSGKNADNTALTLRSVSKKHDSSYQLEVKATNAAGNVLVNKTISNPFNEMFDYRGFLVFSKLKAWLEKELVDTDVKKTQ